MLYRLLQYLRREFGRSIFFLVRNSSPRGFPALTSSLNSPFMPSPPPPSPGTIPLSSEKAWLIFSRRRRSIIEWLALRSASRDKGLDEPFPLECAEERLRSMFKSDVDLTWVLSRGKRTRLKGRHYLTRLRIYEG